MNQKESRIAAIILAMVATSVGMLAWGLHMDDGTDRFGPMRSFMAGGQEHVAVFHSNHLHLIDAAGKRWGRQPFHDLLLTEEPNDMDWTVDAQGKVQAWFFEDTAPRVVRCDLAASGERLEACVQAAAGPQLKANERSRAVHIAVDVARARMFVADAHGQAVRAFSLDGRLLSESAKGELFFPNRLRITGDSLMVADNDHHRIAWLDIAADKPSFALRRSLRSQDHPQLRTGRNRVADFALVPDALGPPSVLWMLAVAQGQKKGDVLVWNAGQPVARADLGGFGDPLFIDRLGNGAIAADFDGVALYRLGARGQYLGAFGDEAVQRDLRTSRARVASAQGWMRAGWVGFAASLLVGFLLAWRYGEKPGQQALVAAFAGCADFPAEVPSGTAVLEPQPWFGRVTGLALGLGGILMVLMPAVMLFILSQQQEGAPAFISSPRVWFIAGLAALVWLSMPVALWWSWRMVRRRLVLAHGHVQVCVGMRILESAPVLQVLASPQSLLIGGTMLPYRRPAMLGRRARWIFDEEQLTRYLLAHLPVSQRVTQHEMARAMMKRMPRWQIAALAIPMASFLAFELWRAFGR